MKKRMRVFAGPNGSGKSSIIKSILNTKISKNKKLDFGIYINADDIAVSLNKKGVSFKDYKIETCAEELFNTANDSGLIHKEFPLSRFKECLIIENNHLKIDVKKASKTDDNPYERIAQILADFLRKKLLEKGEKFSFETVFSHRSKIDIIKKAQANGYKVYLYFVSTEDPEINVYRVKKVRVKNRGHDVPEDKIIQRYYRSMKLMYEAAQYSHQAFFFDNSKTGGKHTLFAHFKLDAKGEKNWDEINKDYVPVWFWKYYSRKT